MTNNDLKGLKKKFEEQFFERAGRTIYCNTSDASKVWNFIKQAAVLEAKKQERQRIMKIIKDTRIPEDKINRSIEFNTSFDLGYNYALSDILQKLEEEE